MHTRACTFLPTVYFIVHTICRLTIYGYWNEGGIVNIVSMLICICNITQHFQCCRSVWAK